MPVLQGVPQAVVATDVEFLRFITQQTRYGIGIGIGNVDAHLLVAVRLSHRSLRGSCGPNMHCSIQLR
jgi:hypothetical protein